MVGFLLPRLFFALSVFFIAGLASNFAWESDFLSWVIAIPAGVVAFFLAVARAPG